MSFNKTISIHAGYDRRASGGGVHGAEVVFALQGDHGALTFAVQTEWIPFVAASDRMAKTPSRLLDVGINPKPLDTIFHFDKELYTAQQHEHSDCPYMPENLPCFSMRRNDLSKALQMALLNGGSEQVWKLLSVGYIDLARLHGGVKEQQ